MRMFFVLMFAMVLAEVATADTVERGRLLLQENCSRCHAIGREGISPHKQAPPFRVVIKRYGALSLSEALGEGLITGHPDMPEFKFEPEDVGAIVDYLRTLENL
jgi:cytochrome c